MQSEPYIDCQTRLTEKTPIALCIQGCTVQVGGKRTKHARLYIKLHRTGHKRCQWAKMGFQGSRGERDCYIITISYGFHDISEAGNISCSSSAL